MPITSSISPKIGDLANLNELDLSASNFAGTIPSEIGNLTALEYLNLADNQLTGEIPSSIGFMLSLKTIYLHNNQLKGAIPSDIGNLKFLETLMLDNNQFSGTIPKALGNCMSLRHVSMNTNHLTGSLPAELGNLKNLAGFAAATNQLTGTLPADLSKCVSLTDFNVFNNRISGTMPAAWANLTALSFLSLGNNQLSGTLPAFIGSLPNLQFLYLQNNQFSGRFPALPNIPEAGYVNIQYNRFTFEGIEQNAAKIDVFHPQTNIPVTFKNKVLSVSAGGNVADNTYHWLIGDVPVRTVTGDSTLALDSSGTYNVYVTNSKIPGASLLSDKYIYTASPLPVKLIRFNAVAGGEGNVLTWTTAEETNNAGFTIEQSADGSRFTKIGFVAGQDAEQLQHTYRFFDVKHFPVTYYRLRQLDHDGTETVSRIVHAGSAVAELKVYPNPAQEQFIVESVRPAAIQVINTEGNVIFQSPKGSEHTISTSGWVPGNYIIRSGASLKKVIISF